MGNVYYIYYYWAILLKLLYLYGRRLPAGIIINKLVVDIGIID